MPALALVLLALCVSVLVACGDADRDEETAIKTLIVEAAASRDPADCTRYLTQRYLEQMSKMSGKAAVTACEEDVVDPRMEAPEKVEVSQVDAAGDSAVAIVSYTGSAYDGQSMELELVKRDSGWKLNATLRFVDLDSEKLVLELGRELMLRQESRRNAEATACFVGLLDRMNDRALEALLLDASLDEFDAFADGCAEPSDSI